MATPTKPDPADLLTTETLPEVAARVLREHLRRDEAEPMRADPSVAELEAALPLALDGSPLPWPQTLDLLRRVLAVTPSTSSRRFFNQLFGGRDPVATLAELCTVVTNSPMHTFKASGVQVMIEREVLRRLGALAGMPEGDGMIAPGGSQSNLAALLLARNEAVEGARERGLPGTRLCVYTSAASHYSVSKAVGILGLGRDNLRKVPIDDDGRMRPDALRQLIERDRDEGALPVMINATACTTVQGAFDPLPAIAEVAESAGVWLHVDAAYGGSILLSERHSHLLEGTDRADSLTWDAHKLLSVPLTCSALLTRRPGLLTASLDEPASYLFQEEALLDPGRASLQCGRRNDALKLWLSWKHRGDEGLGRRIDHLFELAAHATARIEAHPELRLAKRPASINVCFEVEGVASRPLCRALWERGVVKIGHAEVDGREVVRWVFVNPDVQTQELDAVLDDLLAVATTLR